MQELELFDQNPEWGMLLSAYQPRQPAPEGGWLPRVGGIDGIPSEQVSAIHGKLIALGMLKIDMGTRTEGIRYQLTPLGKQALIPPAARQTQHEWQLAEEAEPVAA